ncbi:transporter [Caulobacter sp. 602-2]|nr:transporter [Caulobacter sp. 602-2]
MSITQPDVLILVPAADEPRFAQSWPPLFERLAAPLRTLGLSVASRPWTDPVEAGAQGIVLPLLSWGYHHREPEWYARLDALEAAGVRAANPPGLLRWNTAKTYLSELAAKGAPVVPTITLDKVTPEAVAQARDRFQVDLVVAKPQVSGGSHRTVKLGRDPDLSDAPTGPALIQPFLPAVGEEGELSLFFFDGAFSHAVTKVAVPGDFRVQPQYGGKVSEIAPEPEALHAAHMVLDALGQPLTYARIDLIRGLDHTPQLMELEIIEPDLFLEHAHDHGAAFAAAVRAAL